MNIAMLLEMAADGLADRTAVGTKSGGLTYGDLLDKVKRAATIFRDSGAEHVVLIDLNTETVPITLYGSAFADKPFVPLNYRLKDEQLQAICKRVVPAIAVVDGAVPDRLGDIDGLTVMTRDEFLAKLDEVEPSEEPPLADPDDIAVLLFTSGTTGEPKAAVLRHRNLVSYVISTVEFMGADEEDCALVSVPPYHIASISAFPHWKVKAVAVVVQRPSSTRRRSRRRPRRVGHQRHGRAHHAEADPRHHGARRRARLADAAGPVPRRRGHARARSSSGRAATHALGRLPASTPTASPRPAPPSPCWVPTITARRSHRPIRRSADGSDRSAARCRASSSRCATTWATRSRWAGRARSGSGASRSRASTSASGLSAPMAGSRPTTAATSTRTASSTWRAASTT